MASTQEIIQQACERFIATAKEVAGFNLDYSPMSLVLVATLMQRYRTYYERAVAAKDPDLENFVHQVSVEATAYIAMVMIKNYQAEWSGASGAPGVKWKGKEFPLQQLLAEELRTGKSNTLLLIADIGNMLEAAKPKPECIKDEKLPPKMKQLAEAAIKDVKSMLKVDLDGTPASLAHIDKALARVKGLIEMAPDHKDQMIAGSADKYGAYIGEVLIAEKGGSWAYYKVGNDIYKAVEAGEKIALPEMIVRAVLSGKTLNMGKKSAASVVEFFALSKEAIEAAANDSYTPEAILQRIPELAAKAVEVAKPLNIELDYTLFSLAGLDEAIAQMKKAFDEQRANGDSAVTERLALCALTFGLYLGETIRRTHGGSWERSKNPDDVAPRLRHRMFLLAPCETVSNFLRGQKMRVNDVSESGNAQQYYQDSRPFLQDEMFKRMLGAAPDEATLADNVSPEPEVAKLVLQQAESCILQTARKYGIVLDFSEESLKTVDELLMKAREIPEAEAAKSQDSDRLNLIYWYGCYAGEVYRRVLGGAWVNTPAGNPAQKVLRLEVEGTSIFVLSKVKKALDNGIGDSVAFMLHATKSILKEQREKSANSGAS